MFDYYQNKKSDKNKFYLLFLDFKNTYITNKLKRPLYNVYN